MYYTNGSLITKTFHGVTFRPGETKEVFGIINDKQFYISSKPKEPPKGDKGDSSTSENQSSKKESKREVKKSSKEEKLADTELNNISEVETAEKHAETTQ